MTRRLGIASLIALLTLALAPMAGAGTTSHEVSAGREPVLRRYAADTWRSLVAMTDPGSGLPADNLSIDGARSVETSTTNIGAYLWSTVLAEALGLVDREEALARMGTTLATLERMERHAPSGQFFNWYDHRTGEKLTVWPATGEDLTPILSSVDNGWLATGLQIVRGAVPELADRAGALYESMDFGFYYRPEENRILFHYAPSTGEAPCCYDTIVSESRIASYVGMAKGEIPQRHYYGAWRTFPDSCDWSWQETRPYGETRQYFGESVFEGAYPYHGARIVPGWGGSAFEDLMPPLFVPEERWGAGSWRMNHPLTVWAQRHHGLEVAEYGYWGFSPANIPEGGYTEYGVDAIGLNPTGYPSNNDGTLVDPGFPGCPDREPQPVPPASAFTNGVVTPHAAFLGLRFAPRAVLDNLRRLERDFDIYSEWGFRDSVNVDTGVVSDFYLALDQGIIMAAVGNELTDDLLRRAFVTDEIRRVLRPVMGVEEFGVRPRGCTITGTSGSDWLVGTNGDDVICGRGGADLVWGGDGDDVVYGDAGRDLVAGGRGDDTLYGGGGHDWLHGGGDDDVLSGAGGDDHLFGARGEDHAEGGAGDDRCRAEGTSGCETGVGISGERAFGQRFEAAAKHALSGS